MFYVLYKIAFRYIQRYWLEGANCVHYTKGVGSGLPLPGIFLNYESKKMYIVHFLCTDFIVCRLICTVHAVSDNIRKTATNRLCFLFLFRASITGKREPGIIAIVCTEMEGGQISESAKAGKCLINDIFS